MMLSRRFEVPVRDASAICTAISRLPRRTVNPLPRPMKATREFAWPRFGSKAKGSESGDWRARFAARRRAVGKTPRPGALRAAEVTVRRSREGFWDAQRRKAMERRLSCGEKASGERQKIDGEDAQPQRFPAHLGPPPETAAFPGWAAQVQPSQLPLVVVRQFPTKGTRELSRQMLAKVNPCYFGAGSPVEVPWAKAHFIGARFSRVKKAHVSTVLRFALPDGTYGPRD